MSVVVERVVDRELAAQIATLLGSRVALNDGDGLPAGWHFPWISCLTSRADLRQDGFPGLGLPLGAHAFPRVLAGGRRATFHRPLRAGAALSRHSQVSREQAKTGPDGEMLILTISHSLHDRTSGPGPAIEEEQTYVLLGGRYRPPDERAHPPAAARLLRTVTPDATMLFQFSALSFNSHRIHLDRDYARAVEGYPDLVVNGGLTTLLMCEVAREDLGIEVRTITVRNRAPLFCDRPIGLWVDDGTPAVRVFACDETGAVAAEMEASADGL